MNRADERWTRRIGNQVKKFPVVADQKINVATLTSHFAAHGQFVIRQKIQLRQFGVESDKLRIRPDVFRQAFPNRLERRFAPSQYAPDAKLKTARCGSNQSAVMTTSCRQAPFRFDRFATQRWRAVAIPGCIFSTRPNAAPKHRRNIGIVIERETRIRQPTRLPQLFDHRIIFAQCQQNVCGGRLRLRRDRKFIRLICFRPDAR